VLNAANDGISTILMYGQTGCGKSFTMSGIELRTARGLFRALQGTDKPTADKHTVTMQFVELCGSKECRVSYFLWICFFFSSKIDAFIL
jgi:hypothetical protein